MTAYFIGHTAPLRYTFGFEISSSGHMLKKSKFIHLAGHYLAGFSLFKTCIMQNKSILDGGGSNAKLIVTRFWSPTLPF
ncbi:hypothetical protein [Parvularcula sp. IMCC14364]|uniref:hypothetical protein n=1 Tax=Parvularcula sp. IMCC14364 TaxID=3067902 RepID=UPI00274104D7|nr:hypothetical protein [Parvularcula sp. IMCC14364]